MDFWWRAGEMVWWVCGVAECVCIVMVMSDVDNSV